jgi:hypothetical protein
LTSGSGTVTRAIEGKEVMVVPRVLTSLRNSEIRERSQRFGEYLLQAGSGLSIDKHLDKMTDDPKERLKFWAAASVITQLDQAPFGIDNIREVIVWGESNTDPAAYLEYKLHEGVPASELSGFELDHRLMRNASNPS